MAPLIEEGHSYAVGELGIALRRRDRIISELQAQLQEQAVQLAELDDTKRRLDAAERELLLFAPQLTQPTEPS